MLIRGGGDLASGVAARLHGVGLRVLINELAQPLVVRRKVAFAEAVYQGIATVEDLAAQKVDTHADVLLVLAEGMLPVLVDEAGESINAFSPVVLVDARMLKRAPETSLNAAGLVVGLGPGFSAGEDCHAVIETMRGHDLGRVIWAGSALADTGVPEAVLQKQGQRVLRAPQAGEMRDGLPIGTLVETGEVVGYVDTAPVTAPFSGVLRGLVADGLRVTRGMKIGDLDPRGDRGYAFRISDKALAVGGGVLEAVLTPPAIRAQLWR